MKFLLKCLALSVITLALTFIIDRSLELKFFQVLFPETVALDDFEYSDFGFLARPDPPLDTNIVIVNIGYLDRGQLADQISQIGRLEPAVIGADVLFSRPIGNLDADSTTNKKLAKAISSVDRFVLSMNLLRTDSLENNIDVNEIAYDSTENTFPALRGKAAEGFVNMFDAYVVDNFFGLSGVKAARSFMPQYEMNGKREYALSVKVVMQYDSSKAVKFLKRENQIEYINFRGNLEIHPSWPPPPPKRYKVINWKESLDSLALDSLSKLITNKIVLLGFTGQTLFDLRYGDMFFTPINKIPLGKSLPDMYGVVIHANIISMILNEDYINSLSPLGEYLFAFIACLLHIALLLYLQRKAPMAFDFIAVLLILVQLTFLSLIRIGLFSLLTFKADLAVALGTMAIAGFVVSQSTYFKKRAKWL